MLYAVAPRTASPSDRRFFASGFANSETSSKSALLRIVEVDIVGNYHLWECASRWATPTLELVGSDSIARPGRMILLTYSGKLAQMFATRSGQTVQSFGGIMRVSLKRSLVI